MADKLVLALPSKGRLEENAAALFDQAGIGLKRDGARGYTGAVKSLPDIDVQYVSASEIATRLRDGSVHFGITGEDLLREEIADMDSVVQLVMPLGFGQADVVVAVPDGWVDVTTMFDLAEVAADFRSRHGKRLRVATKYAHLTTDFFARHHVADYEWVPSFGATEAAPNSGAAEAIVDITSTGATLAANQLRVPDDGVILRSEANLAASLKADWSAGARSAAKKLLARLGAYRRAQDLVQITVSSSPGMAGPRLSPDDLAGLFTRFQAVEDQYFQGATSTGGSFFGFQVPSKAQDAFITAMLEKGFERASVAKLDFVYDKRNPLYERLVGALD